MANYADSLRVNLIANTRPFLRGITTAKVAMAGFIGLAGKLSIDSYKRFAKFETGMAQIATLTKKSKGEIDSLGKTLLRTKAKYGVSMEELLFGAYKALSAGVNFNKLPGFMEEVTKTAVAGNADLVSSTEVGIAAVNTYGKKLGGATDVVDQLREANEQLFEAVRLGNFLPEKLFKQLHKFLSMGSQMKLPFNDLLSMMVVSTRKGLPAEWAATGISSLLMNIAKPSVAAKNMAGRLKVDISGTALKEKGWQKFLGDIIAASSKFAGKELPIIKRGKKVGSEKFTQMEILTQIFRNRRAARLASTLFEGAFIDALNKVSKSILTQKTMFPEALTKMMGTQHKKQAQFMELMENYSISFGKGISDGFALGNTESKNMLITMQELEESGYYFGKYIKLAWIGLNEVVNKAVNVGYKQYVRAKAAYEKGGTLEVAKQSVVGQLGKAMNDYTWRLPLKWALKQFSTESRAKIVGLTPKEQMRSRRAIFEKVQRGERMKGRYPDTPVKAHQKDVSIWESLGGIYGKSKSQVMKDNQQRAALKGKLDGLDQAYYERKNKISKAKSDLAKKWGQREGWYQPETHKAEDYFNKTKVPRREERLSELLIALNRTGVGSVTEQRITNGILKSIEKLLGNPSFKATAKKTVINVTNDVTNAQIDLQRAFGNYEYGLDGNDTSKILTPKDSRTSFKEKPKSTPNFDYKKKPYKGKDFSYKPKDYTGTDFGITPKKTTKGFKDWKEEEDDSWGASW